MGQKSYCEYVTVLNELSNIITLLLFTTTEKYAFIRQWLLT